MLGAIAGLCRDRQLFKNILAAESTSEIEEIIKTWQHGVLAEEKI
jgi:gamma-glutamyl-gamma-aminobutyrate hydrolase PuuD